MFKQIILALKSYEASQSTNSLAFFYTFLYFFQLCSILFEMEHQNCTHHSNCNCFIDLYDIGRFIFNLVHNNPCHGICLLHCYTLSWCFHWAIQSNLKISFLCSSPAVNIWSHLSTLGGRESIHDPSILYPDGSCNKDESDLMLLGKIKGRLMKLVFFLHFWSMQHFSPLLVKAK